MMTEPAPDISTYDDFRLFLRDWFERRKKIDPSWTYREFSRRAGFKSPNQLWLVIRGKRNVTPESLPQYLSVLELKYADRKTFEALVLFNQAEGVEEQKIRWKELCELKKRRGNVLEAEQYKYLTNWYYAAVCEMVNLKDFSEDGAWISKRLGSLITPRQAEESLRVLLDLKLVTRDENGRLKQSAGYITTGDQAQSLAAALYHEQMTRLILDAIRERGPAERNVTGLTFTMRREDYDQVVTAMNDFRKRIAAFVTSRLVQGQDDRLYQFSMNLVPLSESAPEPEKESA